MSEFLKNISNYESGISYTIYRFDKISNFLTFSQYKEKKVREYAQLLINGKGE